MARVVLNISGMHVQYWDRTAQQAMYAIIILPCSSLSKRSPYIIVLQYQPDMSYVCLYFSTNQVVLPLHEHEGDYIDRT